ncbi:MAG: acyltransferase family protein [Gammaproteobacteria bacterium]|jgi:peptidoglycan/LPS O-acetylase OafA/YrhL|nr:acyltransferase family protein [Gammaproteobacteria bacterium]
MVSFFFVLSGFVLVLAYAGRPPAQRQPIAFWWARMARIVPLYLLALVLSILLFWDRPDTTALAMVLDLVFLQAWFPPHPLAINGPAWSLSVEAFFYLSFPLWLAMLVRARLRPWVWLSWSGLAWLFSTLLLANLIQPDFYRGFPSISFDLIHFLPLTHLTSFWLGMASGWWFLDRQARKAPLSLLQSLVALSLTALGVFLALELKDSYASLGGFSAPLQASFFAPLFAALILSVAMADPRATGWLKIWPLALLGEASYALYLLQQPLQRLFELLLAPHLVTYWEVSSDTLFYLYLAVLVLLSVLVLYTFERPLQRWLRANPPSSNWPTHQ